MNDSNPPTLLEQLGLLGTRGGPGPSLMAASHDAWLIESGSVDVFLVAAGESRAGGARDYLFSVGAGQLLLFPGGGADEAALTAAPCPDARYRVIARPALLALLREARWQGDAVLLLDELIGNIGAAFKQAAPAAALALTPGARCSSVGQTLTLVPHAAAVWCVLDTGAADYMGTALAPASLVPLPPRTWVTLAPHSQLAARATSAVCDGAPGDELLAGMDLLLLTLLRCATRQKKRQDADELSRLHMRSAIGGKAMHDALGNFVSLFEARPANPADGGHDDRILAACTLLGVRQGIGFRAAPPAGATRHDPVKGIAQASGVRTRKVTLKGRWWRKDNGPLLAFLEQSRDAYALLPIRGGGYEAIDPDTGTRSTVDADFAATLAPFAHMFYAGLPAKQLTLPDILRFVSFGLGPDIRTVAAIGLASALLGMAVPLASGHLFNDVFPAAERGRMVQVVALLFIASVVTLLFEATRALAMLRIEGRAGSDLQAAVWDRVLALPVPFFRDYSAGDLATRINGINEIRQALSGTVISSVVSGVFSVLNIFLLFYYSVRLAAVAILLVLLAVLVNLALGYLSVDIRRRSADVNGKVAGLVLEYLIGITKLRITGSESRAFANWASGFADQKRLALRAGGLANMSGVFGAAFPLVANSALFASIALAGNETPRLSTGDFIAFSAAWTIFLASTLALVRSAIDLLGIASTFQRTRPILDALPEVDRGKAYPGTLAGAIELSNISFSYAPEAPVLDNVSMSIRPGEFVALVGASGSGKSTLLRLMLGFEQPALGGIYYDEHNLADVDVGAVRRQLGVVLQSGRLMSGDIMSNILGATSLTLADAWEAARACGLEDDINAMPMGMHSVISDSDGTLSGGQRQRLLIARAIVNKPRIVFFDEATSALDNRSQAIVSASMERLRATRVVIAHRLSTIINADRIYVLDKGKIVQCGSYQQLIGQDGLFAELAKRQLA
ncbi:NHLM bacteriocin system ABC transporter ATP-binding protein [Oxalobacteraceae bacterium GrIS 1.11]